ncbi:hypothetical protein ACWGJ6_30075 [Streptomyces canus]|nr:hypothetical protein OH837_46120 [Streptomyces canus]WSZ28424.1 hypothetical protein OG806_02700 [Streptomyces sp. NBC_00882]WSZ55451.1 hypothetical protein OH824_02270 [Streptomyces canus]
MTVPAPKVDLGDGSAWRGFTSGGALGQYAAAVTARLARGPVLP